jgi:hypothetical protein
MNTRYRSDILYAYLRKKKHVLAALAPLAEGLCFTLLPAVKTEQSTIILAGTQGQTVSMKE